jgi:hypothetical protein
MARRRRENGDKARPMTGRRWPVRNPIKQLALLGIAATALGACGSSGPAPFVVVHPTGDVGITGCGLDSGGFAVAQIRVTNHSSSTADYEVTVAFTAGGLTSPSGPGFVGGVSAGKSAPGQVVGTKTLPAHSSVTCKLVTVRRTPSTAPTTT